MLSDDGGGASQLSSGLKRGILFANGEHVGSSGNVTVEEKHPTAIHGRMKQAWNKLYLEVVTVALQGM